MYIAFTRSLERPTKMQYNLLDLVGWESKASVSVIVRGWMKVVDWSRGSNGNDTRRLFPSVDQPYDRRWEELFGSFFDDKLSGHSIGRIVMGRRRFGITSKLPRPSRDAYLDPPLRLFPVGSKLVSPPRPSTSAAGPSTSTCTYNLAYHGDRDQRGELIPTDSCSSLTQQEAVQVAASCNYERQSPRRYSVCCQGSTHLQKAFWWW